MRLSTPVIVAIIGALGVIIAAVIPAIITWTNADEPKPLPKFSPRSLDSEFFPSGWMGDAEKGDAFLTISTVAEKINGNSAVATCFSYTRGDEGWAGVYWLYPERNWGDHPGLNLQGASSIKFFARGQNGGEVVEFISGGVKGEHTDKYRVSTGRKALNTDWTAYDLTLKGKDLSSVIGGFAWSAPGSALNPIEFCVADVTIL